MKKRWRGWGGGMEMTSYPASPGPQPWGAVHISHKEVRNSKKVDKCRLNEKVQWCQNCNLLNNKSAAQAKNECILLISRNQITL